MSQAPAKKLLQTSRGETLEHADGKYCNVTIRQYFQKNALKMPFGMLTNLNKAMIFDAHRQIPVKIS